VVENEAVPAESGGVPNDRTDVDWVVDRFGYYESPGRRGEFTR
jgi:hypothetical protein